MKQLTSPAQIKDLGTIMGIWAHPDDETFTCAGVMAAAVQNGQKVVCVTATKGEAGQSADPTKWPLANLGTIRAKELTEALRILGVKDHHWLGYMDSDCCNIDDQVVVPRICELIEQYQPDTILTFPPDGITGHPDHRSISRWSCLAAKSSKKPIQVLCAVDTKEQYDDFLKAADEKFNFYFMVDEPVVIPQDECDVYFDLPPDLVDLKVAALKAMPSQYAEVFKSGEDWLYEGLKLEAFVRSDRNDITWN